MIFIENVKFFNAAAFLLQFVGQKDSRLEKETNARSDSKSIFPINYIAF